MKIETKEKDFKPVVITLETAEEVSLFYQVGNYCNPVAKILREKSCGAIKEGDAHKILLQLYERIGNHVD